MLWPKQTCVYTFYFFLSSDGVVLGFESHGAFDDSDRTARQYQLLVSEASHSLGVRGLRGLETKMEILLTNLLAMRALMGQGRS